jgi:hypothetical protein
VAGKYPTSPSTLAALFALPLLWTACTEPAPDLPALAERSRALLQLESCEYLYHDIIYQSSQEKLLGLITTKDNRLLFSLDIRVSAGLDLAAAPVLRLEQDATGKDTLVVALPPARVTGVDADEATIHQYFLHEYGWAGAQPVKWLEVQAEVGRAKGRASADAVRRGMLDNAWDNAAQALSGFFRLAGFKQVRVEKATPPGGQS